MQDKTLQAEVEKPMVFLKLEICFFGFFVFNGFLVFRFKSRKPKIALKHDLYGQREYSVNTVKYKFM